MAQEFGVGPNALFLPPGLAVGLQLKLDSPVIASRGSVFCGLQSFHLASITALACVELTCDEGTPLATLDNFHIPPTNPRKLEVGLVGCNCSPQASFVTEKRETFDSHRLITDLSAVAGCVTEINLLEARVCSGQAEADDSEDDDDDGDELDLELEGLEEDRPGRVPAPPSSQLSV